MPQYEYKIIKIPSNQQQFYLTYLPYFGWQVQNIQQNVDKVVNRSMGFSNSTNTGSMFAQSFYHPHTNTMNTYGSTYNHGWGSQINTEITDIKTSLTVTFFRDINIPDRNFLIDAEKKFNAAAKPYLARVEKENKWGDDNWPERREVNKFASEGMTLIKNNQHSVPPQIKASPAQPKPATSDQPAAPPPVPAEPPSAVILGMEITQNVYQSGEPGMQILVHFNINNRKGIQCRMSAYFYDANRNPLKDVNRRFKTVDGNVSVGSTFTPGFDKCWYNHYILYMPYSELDRPDGSYNLGFDARIYDEITKTFLAATPYATFHFTKEGQEMRGENLSTPVIPNANTSTLKPALPKNKKTKTAPEAQPATVVKPPTTQQYVALFRKNFGWEVLTEDRKVFLEGVALFHKGKYEQVQEFCEKAIDINPREPIYWTFARPFRGKEQIDEETEFLKKGLEYNPGDASILYNLGNCYILKSDLAQAQAIADQIDQTSAGGKINYLLLSAQIAEARQDYKTAIQFYDRGREFQDPETRKAMEYHRERCRKLMKEQNKPGK